MQHCDRGDRAIGSEDSRAHARCDESLRIHKKATAIRRMLLALAGHQSADDGWPVAVASVTTTDEPWSGTERNGNERRTWSGGAVRANDAHCAETEERLNRSVGGRCAGLGAASTHPEKYLTDARPGARRAQLAVPACSGSSSDGDGDGEGEGSCLQPVVRQPHCFSDM